MKLTLLDHQFGCRGVEGCLAQANRANTANLSSDEVNHEFRSAHLGLPGYGATPG